MRMNVVHDPLPEGVTEVSIPAPEAKLRYSATIPSKYTSIAATKPGGNAAASHHGFDGTPGKANDVGCGPEASVLGGEAAVRSDAAAFERCHDAMQVCTSSSASTHSRIESIVCCELQLRSASFVRQLLKIGARQWNTPYYRAANTRIADGHPFA